MTENEEKINSIKQQIKDISEKNLSYKEALFINHNIEKDKYDIVRAYMESCVMSVQSKLLDSIVESEYDPVYGSRYKTVKKIDNLITHICQDLI